MKELSVLRADYEADPLAWDKFSVDQHDAMKIRLRPEANKAFSDDQRFWLERWWLECTSRDVQTANDALPVHIRVEAIEYKGILYLGSDLLTDTENFREAYGIFETLTRVLIDVDAFRAEKALEPLGGADVPVLTAAAADSDTTAVTASEHKVAIAYT